MNILVMDDVPSRTLDLIALDHDVKTAETVAHFRFWWREVPEWKPDIICLDHDMPYIDGTDLIKLFPELAYEVIWIWSHNGPAAKLMKHMLLETYDEARLVVHPACANGWEAAMAKAFQHTVF